MPCHRLCPGHVLGLEADSSCPSEPFEQCSPLLLSSPDLDCHTSPDPGGVDLLASLGPVATICREHHVGLGDRNDSCRAGEARQVANIGEVGHQEAVELVRNKRQPEPIKSSVEVERSKVSHHASSSRSRATASMASS